MTPPSCAPEDLPLPLAVAGQPAISSNETIEYTAFTAIQRRFQLKTSKAVAQNELSGSRQRLWLRWDQFDFVENTQHWRRIHEGGRTSKRQGTKLRRKQGMSLLVA